MVALEIIKIFLPKPNYGVFLVRIINRNLLHTSRYITYHLCDITVLLFHTRYDILFLFKSLFIDVANI